MSNSAFGFWAPWGSLCFRLQTLQELVPQSCFQPNPLLLRGRFKDALGALCPCRADFQSTRVLQNAHSKPRAADGHLPPRRPVQWGVELWQFWHLPRCGLPAVSHRERDERAFLLCLYQHRERRRPHTATLYAGSECFICFSSTTEMSFMHNSLRIVWQKNTGVRTSEFKSCIHSLLRKSHPFRFSTSWNVSGIKQKHFLWICIESKIKHTCTACGPVSALNGCFVIVHGWTRSISDP